MRRFWIVAFQCQYFVTVRGKVISFPSLRTEGLKIAFTGFNGLNQKSKFCRNSTPTPNPLPLAGGLGQG